MSSTKNVHGSNLQTDSLTLRSLNHIIKVQKSLHFFLSLSLSLPSFFSPFTHLFMLLCDACKYAYFVLRLLIHSVRFSMSGENFSSNNFKGKIQITNEKKRLEWPEHVKREWRKCWEKQKKPWAKRRQNGWKSDQCNGIWKPNINVPHKDEDMNGVAVECLWATEKHTIQEEEAAKKSESENLSISWTYLWLRLENAEKLI